MGVTYDNDFYDDKPLTLDEPLRFPRIGYDNVVTEANVLASTSLAGFPAESVGNSFTFELWKPSELPASIDIDAGSPVTADYVAFGAHNLTGCRITLSYSTDGVTFADAVEAVVVRNRAGMLLFEPVTARYWRLDILGWASSATLSLDFVNREYRVGAFSEAQDTYLGVLYLGRALQMERGIYQGHTPGEFARNDQIRPSVSEGGQWLGRTVVRKGYQTEYSFSNLRADWVRSTLAPFLDAAVTEPFFVAWRPETKAGEVLFGWTERPIVPTNSGPRDLMSAAFTVSAHGEQAAAADKFEPATVEYSEALTLAEQSPKWVYDSQGVLVEVPAGQPAYDHDPVTGEPLGQLIEEQRTRLNTVAADPTVAETVTVTAVTHTLSFFGSGSVVLSGTATGTLAGAGAGVRATLTFTATAGSLTLTPSGDVSDLQLEAGAFASSVIKGEGTQVTRLADNLSRTLGAEFNASEGTFFFDVVVNGAPPVGSIVSLGSDNNSRLFQMVRRGSGDVAIQVFDTAFALYSLESPYGPGSRYKAAVSYSAAGWALSLNGSFSSGGQEPNRGLSSLLRIGALATGTINSSNSFLTIRHYARALTESEMIALTAPEPN